MRIGIIGLGRLGSALARGLHRAGPSDNIYGCNRGVTKGQALAARIPSLHLCVSDTEVLRECGLVFLWTKPSDAEQVLQSNGVLIAGQETLIVSCTAGVPLAKFTTRWAESLPNVNMPTGRGVTALHFAPTLSETDRRLVHDVLSSVGTVHVLPPDEILFFSALCSCGPALYATMLEILADTLADRRGYDRSLCRRMVRDTMFGTILLQEMDGADAAEIVKQVAHPGGPSEAGVSHLRSALPACYEMMLQKMQKW